MADLVLRRRGPLALAGANAPSVAHDGPDAVGKPLGASPHPALTPPLTRLLLRGPAEALTEGVETALGLPLPRQACRAESAGARHALWLGPDEWLLLAPDAEAVQVSATLETALATVAHALVDISHRQIGLALEGERAAEILSAGCPIDLDPPAFPVGMCTRTLLGKAEVVLWRTHPDRFHIEVWRSFSAYVWSFLQTARADTP